jgi:hypothetical protein
MPEFIGDLSGFHLLTLLQSETRGTAFFCSPRFVFTYSDWEIQVGQRLALMTLIF